jgi:hypothetical protein
MGTEAGPHLRSPQCFGVARESSLGLGPRSAAIGAPDIRQIQSLNQQVDPHSPGVPLGRLFRLIASESARAVPGTPFQQGTFSPMMICASNIANVSLGLAPLLVRLEIREWLSAAPYDRDGAMGNEALPDGLIVSAAFGWVSPVTRS